MDELFYKAVSGPPTQNLRECQVKTAEFTILCVLAADPTTRIETLKKRLQTSTETSSAQNISYIFNTCIATDISPDDVEDLIEKVAHFAQEHPTWTEYLKWALVLFHYYCTDDVTLSLFSEFGVPPVAVRVLKDFPHNQQLSLAACVVLSHFNLYDIGDGITQLAHALEVHCSDVLIVLTATRALAEFTSFCKEAPDRSVQGSQEFVDAGGVSAIEGILHAHVGNEEIMTYAARIVANVSSAVVTDALEADSRVLMYLVEALDRYQESVMLCSHVIRVLSNFPRSKFVNWKVIASLADNPQSDLVALECVHFLNKVAINAKELKSMIYTSDSVPRVIEIMRRYPHDASIQEEACCLLSYLSFDSEVITSTITELGGIQLVLGAMRHFPENEELLMAACAALSGLTFNNTSGQLVMSSSEGVRLILDAMCRGTKPRLQENGCLAIGTMCWNGDLKADVVRLGGVKVILRALAEHSASPGVVKNACRALAQVAFNCERYRDEMSSSGAIPLIIRGMEQHPNYDRAQMHGCVALSYLSWTNEANAATITANRGYEVVVEAMQNHPNSHEVQEHACRALANINNVSLKAAAAALERIVAAMRHHERVCEVQEEGCRAIVTLSLASSVNKDRLHELNGAEVVLVALRNYPHVQLVQQEACNAVAHLAYEHADLNKDVTEMGGVELLLRAMQNHESSPKVQLNACGGLSALAFDNTVAQLQIFELGGVQRIIFAMEHFERLRMLELGCSVLGTLAWNTETKEKVAVDAIPQIVKVMRAHEGNPLLQKSTCRAISQFAFNSESNRKLLSAYGAIPLIVKAMRAHLTSEKLIAHALKALTYLCWENTEVAEAIIGEGVEEVLQGIVEHYASTKRVFNEGVHLAKILFRKTTGSPSPNICLISPPISSPFVFSQTPGPRRNLRAVVPPSPAPLPDGQGSRIYSAPTDGTHSRAPVYSGHYPGIRSLGDDTDGRRGGRYDRRRRGGSDAMTRGRRGAGRGHDRVLYTDPNSYRIGVEPTTEVVATRFPCHQSTRHGCKGDSSGGVPFSPAREDAWDDPDPNTFYGNRQLGHLNWQGAELVAQQESAGSHVKGKPVNPGGGRSQGKPKRSGPRAHGRRGGRQEGGEGGIHDCWDDPAVHS